MRERMEEDGGTADQKELESDILKSGVKNEADPKR